MPKRLITNEDEKDTLSTFELSTYIGVQRGTIMQWLRRGVIEEPSRDETGRRLFTREQAEAIKARLKTPA